MRDRERPLRVAVLARVVYPLHSHGGLQRHTYDLVRCLSDRGVHVTLVTQPHAAHRPDDPEADAVFQRSNVEVRAVPYRTFPLAGRRGTTILDRITAYPLFGLRAGRTAARLVRDARIDLVYGLGAASLGYARHWPAPAPGRAPFVFNPQGLEEFGATDPSRAPLKRLAYMPLRRAVRACAHSADRVIATDEVLVEPVLTHLGVPRRSVVVIPNAIEASTCDRPHQQRQALVLRQSLGLAPSDPLLVSVGRLEANKGFHVLVDALAAPRAREALGPTWHWALVGDGPMRERLARQIGSRGLTPHVSITGRLDEAGLHAWYEAATLFVHPTLYEGSSLVTLEAMAHRRPVVATRAGGLPDKVRPGVNGWLVPPGDPHALATAVADALGDRRRLHAMGIESRRIVDAAFSWGTVAQRFLALFEELVRTRSAGT